MMKQYVKQKVKHKMKLYLTRVTVRQMKEQHGEMKHSVKRRKKVVTEGEDSEESEEAKLTCIM